MKRTRSLIFLAGLTLLAPAASRAQSGYSIQSLVKAGDTIAGVKLAPFNEPDFGILGLNDNDDLVFSALDTEGNRVLFDDNGGKFTRIAGEGDTVGGVALHALSGGIGPTFNGQTIFFGLDPDFNDLMFQYAGGKTTLIAGPGMPAPGGSFGTGSHWGITQPVSMNWQGSVVFQAYLTPTTPYPPGIRVPTQPAVFLWNAAKQQLTTVAGPGTKLSDMTIFSAQGGDAPVINNNNEMVINVSGGGPKPTDYFQGLMFVGADGKLQPIVQYGQRLPDGKTAGGGSHPVLNDAGVVAFAPPGGGAYYLWDKATGSTVGPIISTGQDAGGGHKVASIAAFSLDPDAANGLIQVRIDDPAFGPFQLYQYTGFADTAAAQTASAEPPTPQVILSSIKGLPPGSYDLHLGPWNVAVEIEPLTFDGFPIDGVKVVSYHGKLPNGAVPLRYDPKRLKLAKALQPAIDAKKAEIAPLGKEIEDLNGQLVQAEKDGDTGKEGDLVKQIEKVVPQYEELMDQLKTLEQLQKDIATGVQPPATSPTGGPAAPSDPPGPFFSFTTPGVYLGDADGGKEAAFWISADRKIKLLLEDGMSTSVGKIRQVYDFPLHFGRNADWNNYYQIALIADVAAGPGGLQDAILLLTPTAAP